MQDDQHVVQAQRQNAKKYMKLTESNTLLPFTIPLEYQACQSFKSLTSPVEE